MSYEPASQTCSVALLCTRAEVTSEGWPIYHKADTIYDGKAMCKRHYEEYLRREADDSQ